MDIIFIEELTVITTIGVYDWEKNIHQKLIFDIEMGFDNRKITSSENINDYLSYADICDAIIQYVEPNFFTLVEQVAEGLSEILLERFHAPWMRIKVSKPGAVVHASQVGVIIERGSRFE